MLARLCVLVLLSAFLVGCGNFEPSAWDALLQKIVNKDDDAMARRFIEAVRTGDYSGARAMLAPNLPGDSDEGLRALHLILDQGEPIETKLIGCNTSSDLGSGKSKTDLTYEIHYRDAWVAGDVLLTKSPDWTFVEGSHFSPIRDSLAVLYRFSLAGKSPLHYAVFALAIVIPVFILFALGVCIRTRVRRKWLWIIFILLGVCAFQFNWSTGSCSFNPASVNVLGAAYFSSSPYSPTIFTLAFPLGAVIFLLGRRRLVASAAPSPPVRTSAE